MAHAEQTKPGLRELTRRAVRAQIAETAMSLFASQGFAETTVDQIATAVGMSARSVFRYFPTKEDMVVGHLDEIGGKLAAALEARPRTEPVWTALRRAMQGHLDNLTADTDANVAMALMLSRTPALQPALLEKRARWVEALVPGVRLRLSGRADAKEIKARAIASSALACLNIAADTWADSGGTNPIGKLLDVAIAAVRD
jgi:AcrR family transcriptional regulator